MASDRATLNVSPREQFGSRSSRRLRREGLIPGIVYGHGSEPRPFQVSERKARMLLGEGHTLLDLVVEGDKAVPVVIKEEQRHPVRDELVHLDCQEVDLKEKITSDVAVELEGVEQAPGVREGGVLEHVTREVNIEALPTDIPDSFVLDVSEMVIGDTYTLSRLSAPPGVTFTAEEPDEITLATLSPPRLEEEPEPELEEDPELIGEEGEGAVPTPEGEEPGEGGDEGAGDDAGSGDDGE